jgi:hypothetical protein
MTRVPEGDEEAALRRRLREVEAEHADLLGKTMGGSSIGNPDLVGHGKDLEREADDLRIRLGEEPRFPQRGTRRSAVTGWLMFVGAIIVIVGGVALLTPR